MPIINLIELARMQGAKVYTTADGYGDIATVQVIGLRKMTTWPLPVGTAVVELGAALK